MVSVKNGMSSVRVRSSPNANAIVDSFLIEFRRSCIYTTGQTRATYKIYRTKLKTKLEIHWNRRRINKMLGEGERNRERDAEWESCVAAGKARERETDSKETSLLSELNFHISVIRGNRMKFSEYVCVYSLICIVGCHVNRVIFQWQSIQVNPMLIDCIEIV